MKKLLFFLWALMFLPALNASAEDMPEAIISGDFEYVLSEDGTAEIAGYTGEDRILVIPETLDGHAVTRIRDEAFNAAI